MDPLTHALAGAAAAAAFAPEARVRRAAVVGAVAALLPDLDVLIRADADPLFQVEMHRQFSHSIAFMPVIAALAATAAWLVWRGRFFGWLAFAMAGVASALLLDAATSYGIQLLWPFMSTRTAWSIVAVVDPAFTLLVGAFLLVSLVRMSAGASALALAAGSVYLGAGIVQHERVRWALESYAAERTHAVERLVVKPTLGNLLVWRGIYIAGGRAHVAAVRAGISAPLQIYPGGSLEIVATSLLDVRRGSILANDIHRFQRLSDGFTAMHPKRPDVLGDIRFSMRADGLEPLWGIRVDPARADEHAPYLEMREWSPLAWERFKSMLAGRPLPPADAIFGSAKSDDMAADGVTGDGVPGNGVTGDAATGERATGKGATGKGATGNAVTGNGVTATGSAADGPGAREK